MMRLQLTQTNFAALAGVGLATHVWALMVTVIALQHGMGESFPWSVSFMVVGLSVPLALVITTGAVGIIYLLLWQARKQSPSHKRLWTWTIVALTVLFVNDFIHDALLLWWGVTLI